MAISLIKFATSQSNSSQLSSQGRADPIPDLIHFLNLPGKESVIADHSIIHTFLKFVKLTHNFLCANLADTSHADEPDSIPGGQVDFLFLENVFKYATKVGNIQTVIISDFSGIHLYHFNNKIIFTALIMNDFSRNQPRHINNEMIFTELIMNDFSGIQQCHYNCGWIMRNHYTIV